MSLMPLCNDHFEIGRCQHGTGNYSTAGKDLEEAAADLKRWCNMLALFIDVKRHQGV
jgi:hypothetical protein